MPVIQGSTKAHTEGYTCLTITESKEQIISGGADGLVKIWERFPEDCLFQHQIDEPVKALASKGVYFVPTTSTSVEFYNLADGTTTIDCRAMRFTASVNHLAISSDLSKLAAASNDFTVKVIDVSDKTENGLLTFTEPNTFQHNAPVLSVCLDPFEEFVASSACDGWLRLWPLKVVQPEKPFKTYRLFDKPVADQSALNVLYRLAWNGSGTKLALCDVSSVKLFSRLGDWHEPSMELKCSCIPRDAYFTDCCFSPDDQFVFAATKGGWLLVWDVQHGAEPLERFRNPNGSAVCSVLWHPKWHGNVFYADEKGFVTSLQVSCASSSSSSNVVKEPRKVTKQLYDDIEMDDGDGDAAATEEEDDAEWMNAIIDAEEDNKSVLKQSGDLSQVNIMEEAFVATQLPSDDDSDDDDNHSGGAEDGIIDVSKIKSAYGWEDDHNVNSSQSDTGQELDLDAVLKQMNDNDKKRMELANDSNNTAAVLPQSISGGMMTMMTHQGPKFTPSQETFQPGSTPFLDRTERFMLWNGIGSIREYRSEEVNDNEPVGSIDVEFHDTAKHHSIHINNQPDYAMADLNDNALILASTGCSLLEDDDEPPSEEELASIHLRSWLPGSVTGDTHCDIQLPPGESIQSVCVCGGYNSDHEDDNDTCDNYPALDTPLLAVVACAAPWNWIRIFSFTGNGLQVVPPLCLDSGGPLLAMAGSRRHLLLVRHDDAQSRPQHQSLQWCQVPVASWAPPTEEGSAAQEWPNDEELFHWKPLPLAPNATLHWIGFSQEGIPFMCDSLGMVFAYVAHNSQQASRNRRLCAWSPILYLRSLLKSPSDHYFMVGASMKLQQVFAVFCKSSRYPRPLPRPLMSTLAFKLPTLTSLPGEVPLFEEEWLRLSTVLNNLQPSSSGHLDVRNELAKQKEIAVKLFALALKMNEESRAFEIANRMPDIATIQIAIRYAARQHRLQFAERLSQLARQKQSQIDAAFGMNASPMQRHHTKVSSSRRVNSVSHQYHSASSSSSEEENETEEKVSPVKVFAKPSVKIMAKPKPDEGAENKLPFRLDDSSEDDDRHNHSTELANATNDWMEGTPLDLNPFRVDTQPSQSSLNLTDDSFSTSLRGGKSFFDSLSISDKKKSSANALLSKEGTTSKKQSTLFGSSIVAASKPKTTASNSKKPAVLKSTNNELFEDWFETSRDLLEEEFPELSADELLVKGKKRFQLEKSTKKPSGMKRKNDSTDPNVEPAAKRKSVAKTLSSGSLDKLKRFAAK